MSLIQKIDADIKEALKSGNKDKLGVLRGLKSDLKYKQIDKGDELTDEDVIEVITSSVKKRRDSIEQFQSAGRNDLVEKERFGLDVVEAYLPRQLSEGELRDVVRETIEETGADSPQQVGQVMKALMPKIKGRADGKMANKLVMEMLAN